MRIYIILTFLLFSISIYGQVVINEFSAANRNDVQDNFNEYEDWIELYNTSSSTVDISGYYLSDNPSVPLKYQIPAGTTISANGFRLIWCSKRDVVVGNNVHTNFKITQTQMSEDIILSNTIGTLVDSHPIDIPNQKNHSTGRTTDGGPDWGVMLNPTPGSPNTNVNQTYAETPGFDQLAGFYTGSVTVTVSTMDPTLTVYYTTNGDEPTNTSAIYTSPLTFTSTTPLRAIAYSGNSNIPPSFIKTKTFFVNETHTVPVISAVGGTIPVLFGGNDNIEPEGHLELFDETGDRVADAAGTYDKHGNDSWAYDQRGVDFVTRDQFGYDYAVKDKIFDNKARTKFQRIMIKAAANDNYSFEMGGAHIRDGYVHELSQRANLEMDERTYKPAVLYMNGQYWGLYEIREKVDDSDFTEYYYDQERKDVQYIKTWGATWARYGGQQALDDWGVLQNFIVNNNMAVPANYASVTDSLNVLSLIDYIILNTHVVCKDWLNYNTSWWRGKNQLGGAKKWRYTLWDMDASFGHYINYTGIPNDSPNADPCDNTSPSIDDPEGHTDMLTSLLDNPDFYALYINRYADLNNTYFTCDSMIGILDEMINVIDPEMQRQIARWGGSYNGWLNNVQDLRDFINTRCTVIDSGIDTCYAVDGPYDLTVIVDPPGSGDVRVNTIIPSNYPFVSDYFSGIPLTLTALPATGNTFIDWTPNNATLNPNNLATQITFDLTVPDTIIARFMVNSSCPPLNATAQSTPENCNMSDGTASASATGGTGPYNFLWDANAGSQITATAINLAAGSYAVTVTDGAGCPEVVTVMVGSVGSFNLTSSSLPAVCSGNNGSASATATGGTMPITYQWDAAAGNQATATAINLLAGTYNVTVSDASGCSQVEMVTVMSDPGTLTSTSSSSPATCGAANGSATVNPSGGPGPFSYSWNTSPPQFSQTAINLVGATYMVSITDAAGCTATNSVVVTANGNITSSITEQEATCTVGNNGSLTAVVNGGTAPFTYVWNTTPSQNGATAINLEPGNYTVSITDASGCTSTQSASLGIVGLLTAQTTSTSASCAGTNDGTATVNINQGLPPYTYEWSTTPGQGTPTAVGLIAGTYLYTVTDANGCVALGSVLVPDGTPFNTSTIANDEQCSLSGASATAVASGGTPPYQYLWNTGSMMSAIGGLPTGTYTVSITDANGCTQVESVSVTSAANGPVLSSTNTNISCPGDNDGTIDLTVGGGTGPFTYSWGNGLAVEDLSGLPAGSYSVLVTDANGCLAVTTVVVTEPAPMTLVPFTTSSNGNDGTAAVNVNGGVPPFMYQWDNGQTTQIADGLSPGTYNVIVTDANGCITQGSVEVSVFSGIEDLASLTKFDIYPNPSTGLFSVELVFSTPEEIELSVFNMLGQRMDNKLDAGMALSIPFNLTRFSGGVYSIVLSTKEGKATRQVIKLD